MRPQLGEFSSIICFKAVITGVEDTLGPEATGVVLTRAGRVRGEAVANQLGIAGSKIPVEELAAALDSALGEKGTRLCSIRGAKREGDKILIEAAETVCSAGEAPGSDRTCTFTLGAVWGALETVMGERYSAKQVTFAPKGDPFDTFEFTKL